MWHYWTLGLLVVLDIIHLGGAILRQDGLSKVTLDTNEANKHENLDKILVEDFKSLQSDQIEALKLVVEQDISKTDSSLPSLSKQPIVKQILDVSKPIPNEKEKSENLNDEKLVDNLFNSLNGKEVPFLVYPIPLNTESGCVIRNRSTSFRVDAHYKVDVDNNGIETNSDFILNISTLS